MKIVLCTGGFDPLHSGHIEYFREAKKLGDQLIVGVNSDNWLVNKKGRAFMSYRERSLIVSAIDCVDAVYQFDDSDVTACNFIKNMKEQYPTDTIIFANGGDRNATNIPEVIIPDVLFKFGVGGNNKANSSSWILDEWKAPKTERPWGYYRVLHEIPGTKVKELTINPGGKLSMQRHSSRAELWFISEGTAILNSKMPGGYSLPSLKLVTHASYTVSKNDWHQLTNPFDQPCKIVEIQYGESCKEDDIERQD